MRRRRKANTTKLEIIQVATSMYLEHGYSNTSARMICEELDISTGNLTFYFPTKEHLLAVLVKMMCDFHEEVIQRFVDEGKTSLMAACLELAFMASICEESESAKDFYLSSYTNPIPLDIIRIRDTQRAQVVFAPYCPEWSQKDFREAELLVSGIEYATIMTTQSSGSLEERIRGGLDGMMRIYHVPPQLRELKLQKVLAMDYRVIGHNILQEFIVYVERANEQALEKVLNR